MRPGKQAMLERRGGPASRWPALAAAALLSLLSAASLLSASAQAAGDPLIQGEKLTGAGVTGIAQFGYSVALSAEGNTAVIGAPEAGGGAGAAWVLTRTGSTWSQQAELTGAGENGGAHFGASVAMSADGTTVVVGGPQDASAAGAAWVFTRAGSSWSQQQELTGAGESGAGEFGESVAISGDGTTAVIGGPEDSSGKGAAWVFTRAGQTFSQQQELTGQNEVDRSEFGYSVALSYAGDTALVGGFGDNEDGAAWVFTRAASTWTEQGSKLTSSGGAEGVGEFLGGFGSSVALSADGNTALIGAFGEGGFSGAAWVFTRSAQAWSRSVKLTAAGEGADGGFGAGVALSADGSSALIGAPEDVGKAGSAWLFARTGSAWAQQQKLVAAGEEGGGGFGFGVALCSNGALGLIGGPEDASRAGAAWAFADSTATCAALNPGTIGKQLPGATAGGRPLITHAKQSHGRWREGHKLARISRSQSPVGTTFSFTLNEAAAVNFVFTQRSGRHSVTRGLLSLKGEAGRNRVSFEGRVSAAPEPQYGKRNPARGGAEFTLGIYKGLVAHIYDTAISGGIGPDRNVIILTGAIAVADRQRLSAGTGADPSAPRSTLRPGRYTLVMTATNAAGRSRPSRLSFTILPGAPAQR